jgi:hypothetical protein
MINSRKGSVVGILLIIIAVLVIGVAVYIYQKNRSASDLVQLSPAPVSAALDSTFNDQTTKITSIPAQYPFYPGCEGLSGVNPICLYHTLSFLAGSITFSPTGNIVAYKIISPGESNEITTKQLIINNEQGIFPGAPTSGGRQLSPNPEGMLFSKNGSKFAYIIGQDGKEALVINQQELPFHDAVSLPEFSPDAKHTAYVAYDGGKFFAVIDGNIGPAFDYINTLSSGEEPEGNFTNTYFVFSEDSDHVAYSASAGNSELIVLDGAEQAKHDRVYNPTFFGNDTLAYYASDNSNSADISDVLIVGNTVKEKATYFDQVHPNPLFEINGQLGTISDQVFYVGSQPVMRSVVTAGDVRWKNVFDQNSLNSAAYTMFVSPDQKHLVVFGSVSDTPSLVIDDKKVALKNVSTQVGNLVFSPDSGKMAFIYGGNDLVVVDLNTYTTTETPVSELSGRDSYPVAVGNNGEVISLGIQNTNDKSSNFISVGNNQGQSYDQIWTPVFSPDGQSIGYGARSGHDLWWVIQKL